jgi:hypothetical protein
VGQDAWNREKSDLTYKGWTEIGEALEVGRVQALRASGQNEPVGKGYALAFQTWLAANGFADIDKQTRMHLFACMENRVAIEAWRANLSISERSKLNHPQSVHRKWKA